MHIRQYVREWFEQQLMPLGIPIEKSRKRPVSEEDCPILCVPTPIERAQPNSKATVARQLQVKVLVWLRGTDDLDDIADDWAVQIEQALGVNDAQGHIKDLSYTGTQIAIDDGQQRLALLEIEYAVVMFTPRNNPEI